MWCSNLLQLNLFIKKTCKREYCDFNLTSGVRCFSLEQKARAIDPKYGVLVYGQVYSIDHGFMVLAQEIIECLRYITPLKCTYDMYVFILKNYHVINSYN